MGGRERIGAVIETGGAIWMLGTLLGIRAAVHAGNMQRALVWGAALAVYPTLMLLLGGFLSYGAAAVMVSPPRMPKLNSDAVVRHYKALADALDATPRAAAAWGDVQTFGATSFRIPGIRALDPWLVTYTNCITGSGVLMRRTALDAERFCHSTHPRRDPLFAAPRPDDGRCGGYLHHPQQAF